MGWGLATVVLIGAILLALWAGQRRLIYFPSAEVPSMPALDPPAEEVSFPTADGLRLSGWFLTGTGPAPRPTAIVFNGNAGHRGYRLPLAIALQRLGLHVLLFDYRGYGGNAGVPTEEGLRADALAARWYLLGRPDVDPERLVYFGESLGAAVAVALAGERPPAALVLRSPFTSLADAGRHHYPFLPVRLLLTDRFASLDAAPRISAPVLVVAGDRDAVIPVAQSRQLSQAFSGAKTLVVISGADHNDDALLAGDEMMRAVATFLQDLPLP